MAVTGFQRTAAEPVFDGRFQVVDYTVETPEGEQVQRQVTRHPGAVTIVAVDELGRRVLFVDQYRAAVDAVCTELPAGKLDHDGEDLEDPAACAGRELIEETGYEAGRLEGIGEYWVSPGWSDERMYVYLASELREVGASAQTHEEAHMQVRWVPVDTALRMVASGEIQDGKSIVGLYLACDRLAAVPVTEAGPGV